MEYVNKRERHSKLDMEVDDCMWMWDSDDASWKKKQIKAQIFARIVLEVNDSVSMQPVATIYHVDAFSKHTMVTLSANE